MQLDFTIVSLPGNAINLTNYISIDPIRVYFTAANWSSEVVLLVNGESEFPACLAIKSIAVPHAREAHAIEGGKERTSAFVVPPSEQSCMLQMWFHSGFLSSQRPPLVYSSLQQEAPCIQLFYRPAHESHCVQS